MSIKKQTLLLFLMKVIRLPLTILTLSLTAKYFGVSLETDLWLVASAGMFSIGLAIWGPINETFRAKFVAIKETEGSNTVNKYSRSLLFYVTIFNLIIIFIIIGFPQLLAKIIAPNFEGNKLENLLFMIRILAPYLLLNQFTTIFTSILNAYEIFYVPEVASLISQILNILFLIVFAKYVGIYSLVVALYLNNSMLLIMLIYQINKIGIPLFNTRNIFEFDGFKLYFTFAIPFFLPYFISQINSIVEKAVATSLGLGVVSILELSKKIPDMLNVILITVVLTILTPVLTKAFVNNDKVSYEKEFISIYQLGLFGITLFIAFYINGIEAISLLLFESKNISIDEMHTIIYISKFFSISLLGVFSYIIFGMSLLSCDKAKIYAFYGSLSQVMVIIIELLFVKWLKIQVFPIAYIMVHYLAAVMMFMYYPYDKYKIIRITLKYYCFTVLSVILSTIIFRIFKFMKFDNILYDQLVKIAYSGMLSMVCVCIIGYLLKINELNLLYRTICKNVKFTKK